MRSNTTLRDELLRSTVRLARLVFAAHSASVFLYDDANDTLCLEATSEARQDLLLGLSIPAFSGIAGWVFQSGEPTAIDELQGAPEFNVEAAASTGYIPTAMLAAPLTVDGVTIGVLEVLDPVQRADETIGRLDTLGELAAHCGAAVAALDRPRAGVVAREAADEQMDRIERGLATLVRVGTEQSRGAIVAVRGLLDSYVQLLGAEGSRA